MGVPMKVFVLHVKKGYDDRAAHMEKMLGRLGIEFEYILDWDIPDLDTAMLSRYFTGRMGECCAMSSCAFKHMEVYKRMVAEQIPYALVFEDDMFLKRNFLKVINAAFEELKRSHGTDKPFWLGTEATVMGFTPRSVRRRGQYVYPGRFLQCAGCYLINISLARAVMDNISAETTDLPFDHYLDSLRARGVFDSYWTYPVISEQGSHTGRMPSSIGNPMRGRFKWIRRRLTFLYKDILYFFR